MEKYQVPRMQYESTGAGTITRILEKPAIRAFEILARTYGVKAEIYRPIKSRTSETMHGFFDDNNGGYEDEPYLVTNIILPSLFRRRQSSNLSILDPFIDSETYMYLANNIPELINFSLVVVRLPSKKVLNYRIQQINPVSNESGIIINRYALAPVLSTDVVRNFEEINESLKKEIERFGKEHNVDSSLTESKETTGEFQYNPIEF